MKTLSLLGTTILLFAFTFAFNKSSHAEAAEAEALHQELTTIGYSVNKRGSKWKVTFKQRTYVRFHTSRNHAPYVDMWVQANKETLELTSGQWLQAKLNTNHGWVLLSDADRR